MPLLKLFVFGPPRLVRGDQQIDLGLRKALALLVYLAISRQPQGRDVLATLFWPESEQRDARGRLRRTLHRLAQAIGDDVLLASGDTVAIHPEADLWVDAELFVGRAAAAPEEAVALYGDDFLAGFTLPDSPAFDEWQFFERERLRQIFAQLLERLVQQGRGAGDWPAVANYARRWVALDQLHESAQRALLEAYAHLGLSAAALRQYQELAHTLESELGAQPEEATTALYEAIRSRRFPPASGAPLPAPAVTPPSERPEQEATGEQPPLVGRERDALTTLLGPGSLGTASSAHSVAEGMQQLLGNAALLTNIDPHMLPPLVGREWELAELIGLLNTPARRLITLQGPGGIGKTRLAQEAGLIALESFADGVFFVPLAPLATHGQIVTALAEQVGIRFSAAGDPRTQLLNHLRQRHLLLICDNFEHLLDGAELLAEILHAAPHTTLLVTSRERLNISGELVVTLGGIEVPEGDADEQALERSAVQLLLQRARQLRPDLDLLPEDIDAIISICRLVQGMPLALILAASWIDMLSFGAIAAEIARSLDFLEAELRDLPARQRSVRAIFDLSWRKLPPAAQRAFARMSAFRGGCTRHAAEQVAGADLRALRALVNSSFVAIERSAQGDRYTIHELLRHYGAEQLATMGETEDVLASHSRYYLALASDLELDLKGRRQVGALAELEADTENIRQSWGWAVGAGAAETAAIDRAMEGMFLYFELRNRHREGVELFRSIVATLAMQHDSASRPWARAVTRLHILHSLMPQAEPALVEIQLQQMLELAQARGDQFEAAFCQMAFGYYFSRVVSDFHRAVEHQEQALFAFSTLGDQFYTGQVLMRLAYCHSLATNTTNMYRLLSQGLEVMRASGDQVGMALTLAYLAQAALQLGYYDKVAAYGHEAIQVGRTVSQHTVSVAAHILAVLHILRGDLEQARLLAVECFTIAARINNALMRALALAALSLHAGISGNAPLGKQLAGESLATLTNPLSLTLAHWGLALAECDLGHNDDARKALEEAMRHARKMSSEAMITWLLPVAALLHARAGQNERATELLARARAHSLSITGWARRWKPLADLENDGGIVRCSNSS